MDIIRDNFNKKTTCRYCNSTFSYNEKDLKNLYFSDELYERTTTSLTKSYNYAKNRTFLNVRDNMWLALCVVILLSCVILPYLVEGKGKLYY